MRILAWFVGLLGFLPGVAAAMVMGVNCTPNATQCGNPAATVAMLQATHAQIYRLRITAPHLLYPGQTYGVGTPAVPTQNVDPVAMVNGPPDTTTCPGITSYPVKLSSAAGFSTGPVAADFLPIGTQICAKNGLTINVDHLPSQYVYTNQNWGLVGAGNLVALVQAANIRIEATVFNAAQPGNAADAPVLDQNGAPCSTSACDAMFKIRVAYLLSQFAQTGALPELISTGNEEDGGASAACGNGASVTLHTYSDLTTLQATCTVTVSLNGDWGDLGDTDMHAQIQKMRDECTVAHANGLKCVDGGIEIIGAELWYADWLWNICTPQDTCRKQADIFQQWGFSKSLGQDNFAQNLQTTCQTFVPPYLNTAHENHALRAKAILTEEARTGPDATDLINFHWYEVPWQGALPMWLEAQATTRKPIMFDEVGVYARSAVDTLRHLGGGIISGAAYFFWWNEEGASGTTHAVGLTDAFSGTDPNLVPIRPQTGGIWNSWITGGGPNLLSGTAQPQPFC